MRNVIPHRPASQCLCAVQQLGRQMEKAPAAISRKAIEAIDNGDRTITIWGDGRQPRTRILALAVTYKWINQKYKRRKAGKRVDVG